MSPGLEIQGAGYLESPLTARMLVGGGYTPKIVSSFLDSDFTESEVPGSSSSRQRETTNPGM